MSCSLSAKAKQGEPRERKNGDGEDRIRDLTHTKADRCEARALPTELRPLSGISPLNIHNSLRRHNSSNNLQNRNATTSRYTLLFIKVFNLTRCRSFSPVFRRPHDEVRLLPKSQDRLGEDRERSKDSQSHSQQQLPVGRLHLLARPKCPSKQF